MLKLVSGAICFLLMGVVRLYQLVISPFLRPVCRFYPSCSHYALGALRRFGLLWGSWLAIKRLSRCHPYCLGGEDPLPEKLPLRRKNG